MARVDARAASADLSSIADSAASTAVCRIITGIDAIARTVTQAAGANQGAAARYTTLTHRTGRAASAAVGRVVGDVYTLARTVAQAAGANQGTATRYTTLS